MRGLLLALLPRESPSIALTVVNQAHLKLLRNVDLVSPPSGEKKNRYNQKEETMSVIPATRAQATRREGCREDVARWQSSCLALQGPRFKPQCSEEAQRTHPGTSKEHDLLRPRNSGQLSAHQSK